MAAICHWGWIYLKIVNDCLNHKMLKLEQTNNLFKGDFKLVNAVFLILFFDLQTGIMINMFQKAW